MKTSTLLALLLLTWISGARAQTTGGTRSQVPAASNAKPAPLIPGFAPDLAQLQEQQQKDAAAALEPINRRYAEGLKQLMQRATAGGDPDTAARARKELERLGPDAGLRVRDAVQTFEQRMVGTTWSFPLSGKTSSIEFRAKGELVVGWNPTGQGFVWRVVNDGTVEVFPYANRQHGETIQVGDGEHSATIAHDGKSIPLTRKEPAPPPSK